MESNLEKDEKLFHQDDQLLIIPITDRDFKNNEFILNKKGSNEN